MAELDAEANSFFLLLVDRPQAEWPAALDEACRDRPEVRAKVERLLADHVLLGTVSYGRNQDEVRSAIDLSDAPGTIIAESYKLLEQIGEGGFGVVYLAEQLAPVRRKV